MGLQTGIKNKNDLDFITSSEICAWQNSNSYYYEYTDIYTSVCIYKFSGGFYLPKKGGIDEQEVFGWPKWSCRIIRC